jgi:hypothetical protein
VQEGITLLSNVSSPVFLRLWSAAFGQVVRSGEQAVSEEKALQKLCQTDNE